MKLEMESKEIKDAEMGVNNKMDSQHEADSVVKASAASTSEPSTDGTQSNKVLDQEFSSISKEVIVLKKEDSKVLDLKNTDSKSEDSVVTSTSDSNSSECQEYEEPSEMLLCHTFNLAAAEVEEEGRILKNCEESRADVSYVQDSNNATALTSQLNGSGSCPTKIPSEENLTAAEKHKSTINIKDSKSHRQNIHYSSESSDYETDQSSDSSDCEEFLDNMRKSAGPTKFPTLTTKGELTMEDLPPVEDLHITVNATELMKIGHILHTIISPEHNEFLVIVQSDGNSNPLDEDSVLFLSPDNPLGKIHDVFGSVSKPNYSVRFNNAEDISKKGVMEKQNVYYSPVNGDLTRYVLVDVLKTQKGSDASWKDNNEPPPDEIDYSDDEQEKLAKQKRRAKTRGKERNWNDGEGEGAASNKMERRDAAYRQKRVFKRASRNTFQSHTPGPSRSSPRPYSPQNFGPPPIPSASPQPFELTSSNSIPFLQRNAPSPQNFGQFLHRNVPSPQPSGPFSHPNVPSPQSFGPLPHSNVQSPQPFGPFPRNSVSPHQHFSVPPTTYVLASPTLALSHAVNAPQLNPPTYMVASQNNAPLQQLSNNFGSSGFSRNVVSPQPFGLASSNSNPFLQRNVPPPQLFGRFPQSNVQSSQLFGPLPQGNVQSPQLFGSLPQGNVQSPQLFQPPSYRNVPSPQPFGPPSHRNVPSPQPFGSFPQSDAPSSRPLGPFPQASGSSLQQVTAPPTSYVLTHNPVLSHAAGSHQLNPSSLMAAPQINVPLQQQLLLQSHQPVTSFFSHPPPNFISHQNSRQVYHGP